jgi:hypothetical protein
MAASQGLRLAVAVNVRDGWCTSRALLWTISSAPTAQNCGWRILAQVAAITKTADRDEKMLFMMRTYTSTYLPRDSWDRAYPLAMSTNRE